MTMLDQLQHLINDAHEAIHSHLQPPAANTPAAQESDPKYALLKRWAQLQSGTIREAGINALDLMRDKGRANEQIFLLVLDFHESESDDSPTKFTVKSAGYSMPLDVYKTFEPFFGSEAAIKQAFKLPNGELSLKTMLRSDPVAYPLAVEVPHDVEGLTRDFDWLAKMKAKLQQAPVN